MNTPTHTVRKLSILLLLTAILVVPAFAQNGEGPSEQEVLTNYSLFSEYYRNDNFKDAEQYMNWLIDNQESVFQVGALKSGTRPETLLKRYRKMYEELAETKEGEARTEYLKKALGIYENGPSILKDMGKEVDEFDWIYDTGRFIQTHLVLWPEKEADIMAKYMQCYEMEPDRLDDYYKMLLIQDLIKKNEKEAVIELMERMENDVTEQTRQQFDVYRNALFSSPEERITFLEGQLEKKRGTEAEFDLMEELFALYRRQGYIEQAKAMALSLANSNPTPRLYQILAQYELDADNREGAIGYFEKLIEMTDDPAQKADYLYNIGNLQFSMNRYQSAVTYANRALSVQPGMSKAQDMKIKAYASAASSCGCTSLSCRAIYWALPGYGQYAPNSEQYFFEGWRPGMTVKVGGCMSWSGLSATVR